jgi:NADH-quinone oxidoreductase subunit I
VKLHGHLASFLVAARATIINALRRPTTSEYPKVERPRPERYRSSFALVHDEHGEEACIGCLACERICPSRVIKLQPGPKKESPVTGKKRGYCDDFTLDLNACIYCELCVQVCPTDAILMVREREVPGFVREDLVLTMDKLYANETLKHRSWADGTKLIDMQAPPKAEKPAPAVTAAPAAADPAVAAAAPAPKEGPA